MPGVRQQVSDPFGWSRSASHFQRFRVLRNGLQEPTLMCDEEEEAPPGMDWMYDEEEYDRMLGFYEQMFGLPPDMVVSMEIHAREALEPWHFIMENYLLSDLTMKGKFGVLVFKNERTLALVTIQGIAVDGDHDEIQISLTPRQVTA